MLANLVHFPGANLVPGTFAIPRYSKKSVEFDVENGRFRRAKIRVSTSESDGKSTAG
jgi:hypothetical protein